jgi:zinc transporter, ZIP family
MPVEITPLTVFYFALITAVATGLGAIPFFILKRTERKWLGVSNAAAIGLMLAASFSLVYEGIEYSLFKTILGMLLGLVFIIWSSKLLHKFNITNVQNMSSMDAKKSIMFLGVMTLHSFTEGIGVGVAFAGGIELGIFITVAIAIHNIPEGLAISLIAVPRGLSPMKAVGWSIFSSLPQPLMAVPAFIFVDQFKAILPIGLGFAAGAMIWMIFSELVTEANEDVSPNTTAIIVTVSIAMMIIFQELIR